MNSPIDRVMETEVLVVGGSGAGVTAAIQAHRMGRRVLLVCKGKVGRSGNAIMAGGGFGVDGYSAKHVVGEERSDERYSREKYFDNIVKEGFFISEQDLVEQFVEDSPPAVKELLEWGERANVHFSFRPPANWSSAGISWGKCVRQGLTEEQGIQVLEDTAVMELVKDGDRIAGALAVDIYSGELLFLRAKAVVLGSGGYQPFSFKNTVTDMTGDGPAMAYRAGAKLADMEFLLAFPTALAPRSLRGSIYPFVFEMALRGISHRVLDKDGKEIVIPEDIYKVCYRTKLSKLCSDYYWGNAIREGRGTANGGVYMDYSQNPRALREENVAMFQKVNAHLYAKGCYKGDNIEEIFRKVVEGEPFEVGLGYEYSMGGLLVDARMGTSVPGLFAGGEASSGLFGACRAGDGLTEMLGQGVRAGRSAAEYCAGMDLPPADREQAESLAANLLRPLETGKGENPIALQAKLEEAADKGFGVIRTGAGLEEALKRVEELKPRFAAMRADSPSRRYNYQWLCALQARNMLICTEAGIRAALMRTESRGCHIRADFPEVDHDNWCVRIVDQNVNGRHCLEKKTPKVTRVPLPTGREDNVMTYFLSEKTGYQSRAGGSAK